MADRQMFGGSHDHARGSPAQNWEAAVLPRWAVLALALLVGGVWAVSVVVGMIDPARAPSPYLHGIFGLIIGGVFGLDKVPQRRPDPPTPPEVATADTTGSEP